MWLSCQELMSGRWKILHFLKDWWKSIPIHQNYNYGFNIKEHSKVCNVCAYFHTYGILFNSISDRKTNDYISLFLSRFLFAPFLALILSSLKFIWYFHNNAYIFFSYFVT